MRIHIHTYLQRQTHTLFHTSSFKQLKISQYQESIISCIKSKYSCRYVGLIRLFNIFLYLLHLKLDKQNLIESERPSSCLNVSLKANLSFAGPANMSSISISKYSCSRKISFSKDLVFLVILFRSRHRQLNIPRESSLYLIVSRNDNFDFR